ncbi:hypothetical protein LTR66_008097 [Elasticomyces elasticus]|nr:hypothetical protein LTR28_001289 [Elasticomyces elasticus]KAK4985673.1 hypothetical protein LTR66_008097 [Elasticomyces elasticus]
MISVINDQSQSIINGLSADVSTFSLPAGNVAAFTDPANAVSIAATGLAAVLTLIERTEPIGALAAIGGAISVGFADVTPKEPQFDGFASISNSVNAVKDATTSALTTWINKLVAEPFPGSDSDLSTDHNQIPQLFKDGAFAQPIAEGALNAASGLRAAFAAPAINYLWQKAGVVVIKASSKSLGFDPCSGDNLFAARWKYCDSNGVMHVLQAWQPGTVFDFAATSSHAVPGVDHLGDFNLDVKTVVLASDNSQNRGGYFADAPTGSDFAATVGRVGNNVQPSDLVFFNLPVCDLDGVSHSVRNDCASEPNPTLQDICIFYALMGRGCSQKHDQKGHEWPLSYTDPKSGAYRPPTGGSTNAGGHIN